MRIEKRDYSHCPWRLIDDRGEEIYIPTEIDHAHLGKTTISGPVCAQTKSELVEIVLKILEGVHEANQKLRARVRELRGGLTEQHPQARS